MATTCSWCGKRFETVGFLTDDGGICCSQRCLGELGASRASHRRGGGPPAIAPAASGEDDTRTGSGFSAKGCCGCLVLLGLLAAAFLCCGAFASIGQ